MTKKYISVINNNDNVEEGGITLLKRDDGSYAVPGGGYVSNRGYAQQVAKRLAFEYPKVSTPMSSLVQKTVTRLTAASRGDGCDMVLGA
jgi:hypothetical protein